MRLLIVEDETRVAKNVRRMLQAAHHVVDVVDEGKLALQKAADNKYDLIILDIGLPDMSGLEVCKEIRNSGNSVPILMLTGFDSVSEKVAGLDAGADDYLAKPFDRPELLARIRALLRRPKRTFSNLLQVGDLKLDTVAHEVYRKDKSIRLMPKEFALLEYLMRRAGEAISRDDLLQHVWGIYSRNSSNRLEVYIRYLREKIDEPFDNKMIQTVRGIGYKIGTV